jgi:choline dehydrogenase
MNMLEKGSKHPSIRATGPATHRRAFTRGLVAAGVGALIEPLLRAGRAVASSSQTVFDYIVVGAGAGGGPVAARLVKAGYSVAVLEAGLDATGDVALSIDPNTGLIYQVPALAAVSSEHPLLSWDFFVKHYANAAQQARDSKFVPDKGILYPRGSTLGGSTAHDAMLFVYPHDDDWNAIADTTGDSSWRPRHMREYFERLERCEYCAPDAAGRGTSGYVNSSRFDPRIFDSFPELKDLSEGDFELPSSYFQGNTLRDVNHPLVARGDTGSFIAPMHVATKVRVSLREHLLTTQAEHPDRLFIITAALASRVLMRGRRAVGIELMQGLNLYEADKLYDPSVEPPVQRIYARREVILSAGVFNTPQLLKLSGIGPRRELRQHGIDVIVNSPGVGQNLQDRYEVSLNVSLRNGIDFYSRCLPFQPDDPCFAEWFSGQGLGLSDPPFFGPYANNALYGARIARSKGRRTLPDLFLAGQATAFNGFFPGYSQMALGNTWTWLILKAHTNNTAGSVTLRSKNPREQPEINFHYFDEGNDRSGDDLEGVVKGIKLARQLVGAAGAAQHVASELAPGPEYQTDDELRQYVKDQAWGHHASCTAKIGCDDDPMAVLDSRFRVRGAQGLRVVDACAFPRIPGFFPVASVMMLGEKAGDDILGDC